MTDRILMGKHANTDFGFGLWVSKPGQNVTDANSYGGNVAFDSGIIVKATQRVLQTGTFTLTPGRPRLAPGNTINFWEYGYGVDRIDIPLINKPEEIDIPEVAIFMAWANSSGAYHPYYANTYQGPGYHTSANLWFANTTNDYECASVDTGWWRFQGLSHIMNDTTENGKVTDWTAQSEPMFASGVRWGCNASYLSVNAYFTPTFSYVGPHAQNATTAFDFNLYTGGSSWPDCIGEHRKHGLISSRSLHVGRSGAAGAEESKVQYKLSLTHPDNCGEKPSYLNFHNGISNNMLGPIAGNLAGGWVNYGLPYVNLPQPEPEGTPGTSYHDPWGIGMRSSHTIVKGRYVIFTQEAGRFGNLYLSTA